MKSDSPYNEEFYNSFEASSKQSAEVIVPQLMEWVRPKSVADAGCGLGIWLSVFREAGVDEVVGFDGDYVERSRLRIPEKCFQPMQLANPTRVSRTFDLAVSLEVAEHLPPSASHTFADFLASLAPVILFSAAVPGQPGTEHINPRWHSFWHAEFGKRGFHVYDPFRPLLWHDERVSLHYRQNIFLYAKKEWVECKASGSLLRHLPQANCLTLLDQDVLEENLSLRAGFRRMPGQILKYLGLGRR